LLHFKLSLVIARSSEFNASKIRITRSNLHDGGSIEQRFLQCCLKGMTCLLRSLIVYCNLVNSIIEIWLQTLSNPHVSVHDGNCKFSTWDQPRYDGLKFEY
jgi:hypothetical protein